MKTKTALHLRTVNKILHWLSRSGQLNPECDSPDKILNEAIDGEESAVIEVEVGLGERDGAGCGPQVGSRGHHEIHGSAITRTTRYCVPLAWEYRSFSGASTECAPHTTPGTPSLTHSPTSTCLATPSHAEPTRLYTQCT